LKDDLSVLVFFLKAISQLFRPAAIDIEDAKDIAVCFRLHGYSGQREPMMEDFFLC